MRSREQARKNLSKHTIRGRSYGIAEAFLAKPGHPDYEAMIALHMSCPAGYEIDHIVPLSKGGPNVLENVQIISRTANRRKGNRV